MQGISRSQVEPLASACLSARVVPVDKRDFTAKPVPLQQRQRLTPPPLRAARKTDPIQV